MKPRYHQAKETKCGGTAAGRHSVLIVPKKLANFTPLEPVEESETSIHGTVSWYRGDGSVYKDFGAPAGFRYDLVSEPGAITLLLIGAILISHRRRS